jgi:hypothetical protein
MFRKSQLDAQGVLAYLDQEPALLEHLPSIRGLVKFFREKRRIWVTRDVCNAAVNFAKAKKEGDITQQVATGHLPETTLIPIPVQKVELL